MVGSFHDAEDIVQETFLKWLTVEKEKIKNTKAYLVRAVTNNCLNHLEMLKRRKNEYLENLNPSDLIDWHKLTDLTHIDLEHEVSAALNVIHKKLEPLEKGIFLLREVFNFDYDELQHIFDKKKDNCRQLFCRAKDKLSLETDKIKIDLPKAGQFLTSFKKACDLGHVSEFIHELGTDISSKLKKS
ncbi:MAG: RNA polymerase subunit sigma [Cytophagales bacterium]|nr:RNA polymerase subunit sigma [Cytophagales bacterium]